MVPDLSTLDVNWWLAGGGGALLLYYFRDKLTGLIPGRNGNKQVDAFAAYLDVQKELTRLGHTREEVSNMPFGQIPSCLVCEGDHDEQKPK